MAASVTDITSWPGLEPLLINLSAGPPYTRLGRALADSTGFQDILGMEHLGGIILGPSAFVYRAVGWGSERCLLRTSAR